MPKRELTRESGLDFDHSCKSLQALLHLRIDLRLQLSFSTSDSASRSQLLNNNTFGWICECLPHQEEDLGLWLLVAQCLRHLDEALQQLVRRFVEVGLSDGDNDSLRREILRFSVLDPPQEVLNAVAERAEAEAVKRCQVLTVELKR